MMRPVAIVLGVLCVALSPRQAAAEHVLFLADSHALGAFGDGVERALLDDGDAKIDEVETYAIGGSAPSWFYHATMSACGYAGRASAVNPPPNPRLCHRMRAPMVTQVLRKDEVVVVALGTNLIIDPLGWTYARDSIVKMARSIHEAGARCFWIGPPHMRRFDAKLDALYGVIEAALNVEGAAPCTLVDSRLFTVYPAQGGDGIHYKFSGGPAIAEAWGRSVAAEVLKELR